MTEIHEFPGTPADLLEECKQDRPDHVVVCMSKVIDGQRMSKVVYTRCGRWEVMGALLAAAIDASQRS